MRVDGGVGVGGQRWVIVMGMGEAICRLRLRARLEAVGCRLVVWREAKYARLLYRWLVGLCSMEANPYLSAMLVLVVLCLYGRTHLT